MPVAEAATPGPTDDPALPSPTVLRAMGAACGLDLSRFRAPHVARTVDRAVTRLGVDGPGALADRLLADPAVRARFRRAVAVSTTGMFRDPAQFALLDRLMRDDERLDRPLRVWSIGTSDGSELCSLALLVQAQDRLDDAVLLGSDLLPENVALARERVRTELDGPARAAVRLEERDVSRSAPAGVWDVVLCRNVLIHLAPEAKHAMLAHAVAGLAPGGLLLLGRSERLPRGDRAGVVDAGASAYRRAT